jgi:hypothetical protein
MAGCKSCSSCSPEQNAKTLKKAEKLEKCERSSNARYPHVLVGSQAIFSDNKLQMIVTVVSDNCDDASDCFTLKPQRVLKDPGNCNTPQDVFEVSQPVGKLQWKLRALL